MFLNFEGLTHKIMFKSKVSLYHSGLFIIFICLVVCINQYVLEVCFSQFLVPPVHGHRSWCQDSWYSVPVIKLVLMFSFYYLFYFLTLLPIFLYNCFCLFCNNKIILYSLFLGFLWADSTISLILPCDRVCGGLIAVTLWKNKEIIL